MYPNNNYNLNVGGRHPQPLNASIISSVDTNQLLMAANSLRTIYGNNANQNAIQSINSFEQNVSFSDHRTDTAVITGVSTQSLPSGQIPERRVIDYGNKSLYSRPDRSFINQMTNNSSAAQNKSQLLDDMTLKLSSNSRSPYSGTKSQYSDEDIYIYGSTSTSRSKGATLPPGIVSMKPSNTSLPPGIVLREDRRDRLSPERCLSPISMRLKKELENRDKNRQFIDLTDDDNEWQQSQRFEEEERTREWDEEHELYRRQYRQHMNPSPQEDPLELERLRIQQMAAIEMGILKDTGRRREKSPSNIRSSYGKNNEWSPEVSPKRLRKRSPSLSPRRRHPSRDRKRSKSPRRRSISPQYKRRRRSSSRSRDRSRRSRSRSTSDRERRLCVNRSLERRRSLTPNRSKNTLNASLNPMQPMVPFGYDMPYHMIRPTIMGGIMPRMMLPLNAMLYDGIVQPHKPSANIKSVPIDRSSSSQSSNKKDNNNLLKDDKLINPTDLLMAERSKLREELTSLKRQYDRKLEEQNLVISKDNGSKDSYAYKQIDKALKELRIVMDSTHSKLTKNFNLVNDIQKSKTKAKEFTENLKVTGDISKTELKPKAPINEKSKKVDKELPKDMDKEVVITIDDTEDEEKNCRFQYFDSGPHWCKCCDQFMSNIKHYFQHIHTKEHLNKQKVAERTPWITKEYIKEQEMNSHNKCFQTRKDKLVIASKGIQFIYPTQGFYCDLCTTFLKDTYEANNHFLTAKHNRNYTRYTLEHNDFEHKWRSERDRAFTDLKRKERETEREKLTKEKDEKAKERKRLEEEVKRKDKEVKDRIKAMNVAKKVVNELDDHKDSNKLVDKTNDKSTASPKIRLNLNSNKSESNNKAKAKSPTSSKSKTPEKGDNSVKKVTKEDKSNSNVDNVVKPSTEMSKESKDETKVMTESHTITKDKTPEELEDMFVVDEVNCDSREGIDEDIDENKLLNMDSNDENDNNKDIDENKLLDIKSDGKNSGDELLKDTKKSTIDGFNDNSIILNENDIKKDNNNKINEQIVDKTQIKDIVYKIHDNQDSDKVSPQSKTNDELSSGFVNQELLQLNAINEYKTNDEITVTTNSGDQTIVESKEDIKTVYNVESDCKAVKSTIDPINCEDMAMPYIDDDDDIIVDKVISAEDVKNNESNKTEIGSSSLKTKCGSQTLLLEIDDDIAGFEQRLAKHNSIDESVDCIADNDVDDELDGFDVIDETNDD